MKEFSKGVKYLLYPNVVLDNLPVVHVHIVHSLKYETSPHMWTY